MCFEIFSALVFNVQMKSFSYWKPFGTIQSTVAQPALLPGILRDFVHYLGWSRNSNCMKIIIKYFGAIYFFCVISKPKQNNTLGGLSD